ncbi:phytanoyl-CoA dioxygenase, partial [Klebsiella pneumoniae subsp. pneumoniae]
RGFGVPFNCPPALGPRATPGAGPRRVFSARWVGDDASFADRGGVTSPPFPELTLRDGDPLDSPLFPQVWPRA